jgi:hypothetical protein
MSFEYDEVISGGDESHSDDETTEPLDYQDWSTIYSEELWDMWYQIQEYLDNRFPYKSDRLCDVEPTDFFSDFCFEYPKEFQKTPEFLEWQDTYWQEMKDIYRIVQPYTNKKIDDLCYFFYTVKKYKQNINVSPRPNICQGGYPSGSIPYIEPWVHPFD